VLREPLLYLSLFFKQHRSLYYDLLNQTRETGDWEAWLIFFFEGVTLTGNQAFATATKLLDLFKADADRIKSLGRAAPSALALHRHFQSNPVGSVRSAKNPLGLSIPTLHASARHLAQLGILREIPTGGKSHLYAYSGYLDILNADTA
jgi:Fic family protein